MDAMHIGNNNLILQGDILLVADKFDDGWMRGLRQGDLEVCIVSLILMVL